MNRAGSENHGHFSVPLGPGFWAKIDFTEPSQPSISHSHAVMTADQFIYYPSYSLLRRKIRNARVIIMKKISYYGT